MSSRFRNTVYFYSLVWRTWETKSKQEWTQVICRSGVSVTSFDDFIDFQCFKRRQLPIRRCNIYSLLLC